MIIPLVPNDYEIFRTKLEDFDFRNLPADPIVVAHDITQSMLSHGGIGLAANQIGLPWRCFVMKTNPVIVCFNPRIVDSSDEQIELEEGCLSWSGIILKIKRPKSIRVRYTQPNGEVVTKTFTGITARIFQHELDHLDGILFIDLVSKLKLDIAKRKAKKRNKNG